MFAPAHIDLPAAAPSTIPVDTMAWLDAEEAEPAWVCSFCGRLRVYEGGRAFGPGDRNDCEECGCRLAVTPEDLATLAKSDTKRGRVRTLIERDLF